FNTLNAIGGAITVDGQGDNDTIIANDAGNTTPHVYGESNNSFARNGMATITFNNVETHTLLRGKEVSGTGAAPQIKNVKFPSSIVAGQTATLSGQLIDADKGNTLSLTINWGDGSASETSTPNFNAFTRSHAFGKAGTYKVQLSWFDNTGRSNKQT